MRRIPQKRRIRVDPKAGRSRACTPVGGPPLAYFPKSTKTKCILLPCPCGLLATSRPIGTTRQTSENARDVLNFMGRPVVGKLQVWVPILPSMIRVLLFRANGQLRRANPPSETLAAAFDRLSPVSRRLDQSHSLFHICSHGSRDAGRSTKPWLEGAHALRQRLSAGNAIHAEVRLPQANLT